MDNSKDKVKLHYDDDGNLTGIDIKNNQEVTTVRGPEGKKGKDGINGKDGIKGDCGATGSTGEQGKPGLDGKDVDPNITKEILKAVGRNKYSLLDEKNKTKTLQEDILTVNGNLTTHISDDTIHFDDEEQKDEVIKHLLLDHTMQIVSEGGIGGLWSRKGTTLSPLWPKDDVSIDGTLNMNNNFIENVGYVQFDIDFTDGQSEGRLQWNKEDGTLEFGLPGGNVNLQVGQELVRKVKNDDTSTILNGQVVYIYGADGVNLLVRRPIASDKNEAPRTIAVATEDIVINGYVTVFGEVRDIDTSGTPVGETWLDGDILWLSTTAEGEMTKNRPIAPNIAVVIGVITRAHATEGSMTVKPIVVQSNALASDVYAPVLDDRDVLKWNEANDRFETGRFVDRDLLNGTFRESFDCRATSNGTTITATLDDPENPSSSILTMQFSDGDVELAVPQDIELTAGSDSSPQNNYIYILQSTKVLTKSTSDWPSEEHIKVCYFFVPSAVEVQTEGPYITQNWNDHLMNGNNQGHLAHMGEKIRLGLKGYNSGIDPNGQDQDTNSSYMNYISGSESYYKSTSGIMYQMHKQAIPAVDTQISGDDIHIINWNGDNYHEISLLNDIIADSEGVSFSNKYFNLFFFEVGNKTGEYSPVMCQLPSGSYVSQTSAENDVDGYDNLTMPRQFSLDSSVGIPICRITLRYSGGLSTLTHISTTDLRSDGLTAGGGAAGATTSFADNQFEIFNVTDNTKILDFDISALTTATTRTITMADRNLSLSTPIFDEMTIATPTNGNWTFLEGGIGLGLISDNTDIGQRFIIYSGAGDGSEHNFLEIQGVGTPTDDTGRTRLTMGWSTTKQLFAINATGDSSDEDLLLFADGTISLTAGSLANQLLLNTDGSIDAAFSIAASSFISNTWRGTTNDDERIEFHNAGSMQFYMNGTQVVTFFNSVKARHMTFNFSQEDIDYNIKTPAIDGFFYIDAANDTLTIGDGGITNYSEFDETGNLTLYGSADLTFNDSATGGDIIFGTTNGTKIGTATSQKLAFYGSTPIVQPTALTTQDTTITHTAPGTPDYAIQDLVDSGVGSAFGFATKDEGNTTLKVIENLQVRVQELEDKLQSLGALA